MVPSASQRSAHRSTNKKSILHEEEKKVNFLDYRYPHSLAQKLNNKASFAMGEKKDYGEAILLLENALELTKWHLSINDIFKLMPECACKTCSLETSLKFAGKDMNQDSQLFLPKDLSFLLEDDETCFLCQDENQDGNIEADQARGFVYSRPLFVSQTSVEEGHFMGLKLTVIIMFNLALAYQLNAIATASKKSCASGSIRTSLNKAIHNYELLQFTLLLHGNSDNNATLRLTVLILNNLSELHRIAGDYTKRRQHLEHLLSTMMYAHHSGSCIRNDEESGKVSLFSMDEIDGLFRNIQASSIMAWSFACAKTA